jgi:hypothetical protein
VSGNPAAALIAQHEPPAGAHAFVLAGIAVIGLLIFGVGWWRRRQRERTRSREEQ